MIDFDSESFVRTYRTKRPESLLAADFAKYSTGCMGRSTARRGSSSVARVDDICRLPLNMERLCKLTEDNFVDNAALQKVLGWDKIPISTAAGMGTTLKSFTAACRRK